MLAFIFFISLLVIFTIAYYIIAGIYIVNDSKKRGEDTSVWTIAHFAGGLFLLTVPLTVYLFKTNRKVAAVLWTVVPFILTFVGMVLVMVISLTAVS